jgi:hypothetical protein
MQAVGILEQAFPGGLQFGEDGMADGTWDGQSLARRVSAQGADEAVGFDHGRQAELAVGIQQFDLADLAQVQPHRVFG